MTDRGRAAISNGDVESVVRYIDPHLLKKNTIIPHSSPRSSGLHQEKPQGLIPTVNNGLPTASACEMADEGLSCERQKLRGHIDNPLQNRYCIASLLSLHIVIGSYLPS